MIDSIYWIWLQLLFDIGSRRAELMMNYFEHPQQIYEGLVNRDRTQGMLTPKEQSSWEEAFRQAGEIQRRTLKKGCAIITPDHPSYPRLLQPIYSKPAALYVKGELDCLRDSLAIAMVGTRKRTDYGRQVAQTLARDLALRGAVVVSGLAVGIDSECHQAALEAGGKTVGILGCGIDVDYPAGSASLKRQMCENGAVVTEYPLGTTPLPRNFPVRNRVISGMCHGTVVLEADKQSGSMLTAQHALDQGRDVYAVPGSIFSYREQGTHQLLKEGAKLVECAEDILEEYAGLAEIIRDLPETNLPDRVDKGEQVPLYEEKLPLDAERIPKAVPEKKTPPDGISDTAAKVYEQFQSEGMTVDEIGVQTGIAMGELLTALTELEIYDLIEGYPGRRFGLK